LSSHKDVAVTAESRVDHQSALTEEPRPLRADALRNRAKLLAAAESLFATEGLDVPIDKIAERAGVGVGTVYRHFPTKEQLYEAILVERVDGLVVRARDLQRVGDPPTAFFEFVDYLVGQFLNYSDLLGAFADAGIEFDVVAAGAKAELEAAVTELLIGAQRSGTVRSDVSAPIVLALISASCKASKTPHPGTTEQMLRIVLDGLRT
jgi:AcrR family transcriptional regulator